MGSPDLRRRALLPALVAAGLVPAARAAGRPRVVGCLLGDGDSTASVRKALADRGYVEGTTLRLEARLHRGSDPGERARAARDLVATRPEAILAWWPYQVMALLEVTRSIPIVCGPIPDPVAAGFAHSLRRPGGNVTGLSTGSHEVWEIVIGMLRTLRPKLKHILVVHSPGMPVPVQMQSHRKAAQAAGLEWSHAALSRVFDAERILAPLAGEAMHLAPITDEDVREAVIEIAHRHRMLTFGGHAKSLMVYARYFSDGPQRIAAILDKVLRGADPAGIPFELPDLTHLRLNRATARLIGVEFPSDMLLRATRIVDS